jgi:hypothetical protein
MLNHARVAVLLVVFAWPMAAFAQLEGSTSFEVAGTTAGEVAQFLGVLQNALRVDDRAAVCALFSYPVVVWDGRRSVEVRNRKAMMRRFNRVFNSDLRAVIASASVANSWANWQGVMWNNGRMWIFVNENNQIRIARINEPTKE